MWKPSAREPVNSVYSIDVPKDTVYLTVDRGRPVAQRSNSRERSPSPDFSDFDNDSFDLKPPVPLKNLKARMQFGKRKQSKSGLPTGLAPKAQTWEPQPQEEPRYAWGARDHRDSPELPDPDMGASLRDDLPVPIASDSRFSWTTYGEPEPPQHDEDDALPDLSSLTFQPQGHGQPQPKSRFSWSTYNTVPRESTDQKSLHSPLSGVISSPPSPPPTPPPAPSVLTRRRPLPRPDEYGFYPDKPVIKRKPTPSEATSVALQSSPRLGMDSDDMKELPDLPQFPKRGESADRVVQLKVELDTLEHRRVNLDKVISGLTALVPSNPVEFDLAKRKEHKERIEAFERELADVKRKEHELGLKLHKAIRRRDENEPSGLWVRRVTG